MMFEIPEIDMDIYEQKEEKKIWSTSFSLD